MKLFIVLALLAPAILAGPVSVSAGARVSTDGINFVAGTNVTIKNDPGDFSFRKATCVEVDIVGFDLAFISLLGVTASGNAQAGSVDASGVFATAFSTPSFLTVPGIPPSAWMAYFDAQASFSSSQNQYAADVSASASFIGTSYAMLEELSGSTVVKTVNLNSLSYGLDVFSNKSASDAQLHYASFKATGPAGNAFTVTIHFVVSEVVGVLNIGGATVTPKSMEVLFELDNWAYANPANQVRLTFYTATAVASGSAKAVGTASYYTNAIISGTGPSQAYLRAATTASANGGSVDVQVTITKEVDGSKLNSVNKYVEAQLQSVGSGKVNLDFATVTVVFPANANKITYDPAYGFEAPNGATKLVPLLAIFATLLAAFVNM